MLAWRPDIGRRELAGRGNKKRNRSGGYLAISGMFNAFIAKDFFR